MPEPDYPSWYTDIVSAPTTAEIDAWEAWLEANEQVLGDGYQELLNLLNELRDLLNTGTAGEILQWWRMFKTAVYIAMLVAGLTPPSTMSGAPG